MVSRTKNAAGSTFAQQALRLGIEEDDEVDVAGIVELAGALLAHGEDDVAAVLARHRRIGERKPAGAVGGKQQMIDGSGDRGIGEAGQGGHDRLAVPDAAEVGQGNEQGRLAAPQPQNHAHVLAVLDRQPGGAQAAAEAVEQILRHFGQAFDSEARTAGDEIAQKGRAIGDGGNKPARGGVAVEQGEQRRAIGRSHPVEKGCQCCVVAWSRRRRQPLPAECGPQ